MESSSALQIERIARSEGQVTTAQHRIELTESELTHLAGGAGNKPTPILLSEAELSQLVGGIGDTGSDSEESGKATPILW